MVLYYLIACRTFFIFRNPQLTDIKVQLIFRPFANNIWLLLLVMLILAIVIFTVVFYFEGSHNTITAFSDSLLTTIGALSQQGKHSIQYIINYQ
jgi:hypothetical protein